MPSLHDALFLELTADTALADLLGASPHSRIFRGVIPQKAPSGRARMPCLVVSISTPDRQVANCGTVGTVMSRVQIDAYALTHEAATALANEVKATLLDFRGMLGGTVRVRAASLENSDELPALEPGLFRVLQSWLIWHREE